MSVARELWFAFCLIAIIIPNESVKLVGMRHFEWKQVLNTYKLYTKHFSCVDNYLQHYDCVSKSFRECLEDLA
jgi:hypothetical protein